MEGANGKAFRNVLSFGGIANNSKHVTVLRISESATCGVPETNGVLAISPHILSHTVCSPASPLSVPLLPEESQETEAENLLTSTTLCGARQAKIVHKALLQVIATAGNACSMYCEILGPRHPGSPERERNHTQSCTSAQQVQQHSLNFAGTAPMGFASLGTHAFA
jgi:hypothetical protein